MLTHFGRQSEFYSVLRPYTRGTGGVHGVVNTTDEAILKQLKPPIAPLYSISSSISFEPRIDEVQECLQKNLDKRFLENGEICNLGEWLQFFAFDVMGTLTFSKRYGFLDTGDDVKGIHSSIVGFMRSNAPVSWNTVLKDKRACAILMVMIDDTSPLVRQTLKKKLHCRQSSANIWPDCLSVYPQLRS